MFQLAGLATAGTANVFSAAINKIDANQQGQSSSGYEASFTGT